MKWNEKKNGQKPIWSESERKRRTKDCFESQSQQRQTVKIATVSLTHLKLGVVQMRRCFFVFFRKCAVMISQIHATTISVAVPITWDEKSSGRSIDRSAQSVLSHFEFYTHTAAANHIVIMCRYINTCETVIRHYVIQSQRVFKWHGICAFSITPYTQMLSNRCVESFCFLCCLCVCVFFFTFNLSWMDRFITIPMALSQSLFFLRAWKTIISYSIDCCALQHTHTYVILWKQNK